MREIRKSGSMRGSGRKALLRKCHLSLSTLPVLAERFRALGFCLPRVFFRDGNFQDMTMQTYG